MPTMPYTNGLLKFESLAKGDVEALAPALASAGMTIAYPHLAEPIVAKLHDEIVGFGFAQLLPHAEPIWVKPQYRGLGIAEKLARMVVEKIESTGAQRFVAVAQNAFAEELCRANGMHEVPGKVFVKEP
jgi:ribosomal protein S18 acetylase RimI-like enzyme